MRTPLALLFAASFPFALLACKDEVVKSTGTAPAPRPAAAADAGAGPVVKAGPEYTESDFIENDRNRDPFRQYATLFLEGQGNKAFAVQRKVLLSQYSVDELRLVAIVTGADYPRAMVIDPTNKGWVLKHGDYVGRADTVHTGGTNGTDYQLNWRVDRVRDGDVVLIREDPAQPTIAPATRVIPLHPETEGKDKQGFGAGTL
jgi:type IV pilus assembly protein PilP